MDEKKTKAAAEKVEDLFSKEQLLASNHFQNRRDIVNALCSDDEQYSISTVDEMVEKYMKGKVN